MTPTEETSKLLRERNGTEDESAVIDSLLEYGASPEEIVYGIAQGAYDVVGNRDAMLCALNDRTREVSFLESDILPKYSKTLFGLPQEYLVIPEEADSSEIKRFNHFSLVHLQNSGVLLEGARLAERRDIERILKENPKSLENCFVGLGLSFFPEPFGEYDPQKKTLMDGLKDRGIGVEGGVLIPYRALNLRGTSKTESRLIMDLKDIPTEQLGIEPLDTYGWDYRWNRLAGAVYRFNGEWGMNFLTDKKISDEGKIVVISNEFSLPETEELEAA